MDALARLYDGALRPGFCWDEVEAVVADLARCPVAELRTALAEYGVDVRGPRAVLLDAVRQLVASRRHFHATFDAVQLM